MKKFKKNQQKLWVTDKGTYRKALRLRDMSAMNYMFYQTSYNRRHRDMFFHDPAKPGICLDGAKFLLLLGFTDEDEVTSDEVCTRLVEIGLTKANQIIDSCLYFTHP